MTWKLKLKTVSNIPAHIFSFLFFFTADEKKNTNKTHRHKNGGKKQHILFLWEFRSRVTLQRPARLARIPFPLVLSASVSRFDHIWSAESCISNRYGIRSMDWIFPCALMMAEPWERQINTCGLLVGIFFSLPSLVFLDETRGDLFHGKWILSFFFCFFCVCCNCFSKSV